ncbi:MAG TPA: exonuclease domain-containing protein [Candidatus Limnocylindrales bacterium]
MAYAVIDVETTGLRPSWHDRIVEIAIVQVDRSGAVEAEWCTLVNPERDLGPQRVHGISAAEARQAPRFKDLAGTVADLLRARIPVAHNWAFDSQFLAAEYERIGVAAPIHAESGLCTMVLAGQFLPESGRGLAACCASAGVSLVNAHSALHDARAAAGLLAHFLSIAGVPPLWMSRLLTGAGTWPAALPGNAATVSRRDEGHVEEHFLARLVAQLPRTHRRTADAYLDVLDRALLDRHISATEADSLVAAAQALGFDRDDLVDLHRQYLQALATVTAADGTLGTGERDDLDGVALLLGLDLDHVDTALSTARHAVALAGGAAGSSVRRLYLRPGDIVAFTGETAEPREAWEAKARRAGLRVEQDVTRRTRLLVAADPDTMSGKAEKANRYGIPIVHPTAFASMLTKLTTR